MHTIRRQYGFTLVELVVVIAVIAILSTIAIVSYDVVLKQSHDSKRESDMTALRTTLENYYNKNGEYPSGCIQPNYSATVSCSVFTDVSSATLTGDGSMYSDTTPADQINADTTLSQLRTMLPGLDESFGDPVNTSDQPISNTFTGAYKYIYIGGLEDKMSSNQRYIVTTNAASSNPTFSCAMWFDLTPNQISSYVIGYYSEQTSTWHLFDGDHGVKISFGYGTDEDGNQIKNSVFCWNHGAAAFFYDRSAS